MITRADACVCILLVVLLIPSYVPSQGVICINEIAAEPLTKQMQLAYESHAPISITSDSDFVSQGWPGNGTQGDPYVIEGLNITSGDAGIHVSGTSSHFVVRNCTLTLTTEYGLYGIRFEYLVNGRIENCSISQKRKGIHIGSSLDCFINNSLISNNTIGIHLDASNVTITNSDLEWNGFEIDKFGNYTMEGVTVNGKPIGFFRNQSDINIDGYAYGQIILAECMNISLSGGVFHYTSFGVQILYSLNCTVQNADIIGSYIGIDVQRSDGCSLIGNKVNECTSTGIRLCIYSHNNRIISNTISSSGGPGICVSDSAFTHIENNNISITVGDALVVSYSESLSIKYNTLVGGGVQMSGSVTEFWVHDVVSNTIDGKELAYHSNLRNTTIELTDESQVIFANCTDVTVRESYLGSNICIIAGFCRNCIFTNITYTGTSSTGIELHHSVGCTVTNCTFDQVGLRSINLKYSTNCSLSRNRIVESGGIEIFHCHGYTILENNSFLGSNDIIYVVYSTNCTLRWNTLTNSNGIYARYAEYLRLFNNTFYSCTKGALIIRSSFCGIFNNTVYDCEQYGFMIEESINCTIAHNSVRYCASTGISMNECSNSSIDYNLLEGNDFGIGVSSNQCNITWNDVISNQGPGICLGMGTSSNLVYGNLIGWNGQGYTELGNARDAGFSNTWDDGISQGNYWSDQWDGENYTIPGYGSGVDRYPSPILAVEHPPDITVEAGSTDDVIRWNASVRGPKEFEVYRNRTLILADSWNGSIISVSLSELGLGTYNHTLVLYEQFGHAINDTVIVNVVDTTPPSITGLTTYEYEAGTSPHSIMLMSSDLYPQSYQILLNGTSTLSGIWNGSEIEVHVAGLSLGAHNFTIVLHDTSMNSGHHTVLVIVVDTISPSISNLTAVEFEAGLEANYLTWNVFDLFPETYDVYVNGSLWRSGEWESGTLEVGFDKVDLGIYNVTIVIYDTSGNWVSDTVFVRVVPPESSVPLILSLSIGAVLCIVLVALALRMRRTGT